MFNRNTMKTIGLTALVGGFAVSVQAQTIPSQDHWEQTPVNYGDEALYWTFDVDFTKTSANSSYNYLTFTNPRSGGTVKYYQLRLVDVVGSGGCYDISTTGASGSDPIISVQNQAGSWQWLADDNYGSAQFGARVYIKPSASYELRISEYSSGNNNNQIQVYIKKVKADAGYDSNNNDSHKCGIYGQPFWQYDVNSGNPYNPS